MKYDFEHVIDRRGTDSLKYDFAEKRGRSSDLLPLWVADMDFRTAPEIIEALQKKVEHGVFGYSEATDAYYSALKRWYRERYGWELEDEWIIKTPGVVVLIALAIKGLTSIGDGIIVQQPVYYSFIEVIEANDRKVVNSPLENVNGRYEIDLVDFENKIIENKVKLFILCNPHNPGGVSWTRAELSGIAEICKKHDVYVISDEIHGDFVYEGYKHTVFASLSEDAATRTITCTSPSKAFNLAGLQISNAVVQNKKLRDIIKKELDGIGYSQQNIMGIVACQAAYEKGEEWFDEMMEYVKSNYDFLREYIANNLPKIKVMNQSATYLVWLDCRELNLKQSELDNIITEKAKLWLDSGTMFGEEGEGYQRINIACPREVLEEALIRLKNAL